VLVSAVLAGLVAVVATLVVAAQLSGNDLEVDATVKLDTPGIYAEPTDVGNRDVSGTPLPDVTFIDTDGAERSLDEFRGSPLVVNLWYKNCPPCARELVDFAEVDAELRAADSPVRFIGLNPNDSADTMLAFAGERGVEYELWRDTQRTFGVEIGVVNYPVTLFVDADGNIVEQVGEIDAAGLRDNIATLFGEPA